MGRRGTSSTVGPTADSADLPGPRGAGQVWIGCRLRGAGSEQGRHPRRRLGSPPSTPPGDNSGHRVDDTRAPCAQLGDSAVEPRPVLPAGTALTCDDGRPRVWSQNSWSRCPFTGRSPGRRRVALSTKPAQTCGQGLIHILIHRCVWASTVLVTSGSDPITVTSLRAPGHRARARLTVLPRSCGARPGDHLTCWHAPLPRSSVGIPCAGRTARRTAPADRRGRSGPGRRRLPERGRPARLRRRHPAGHDLRRQERRPGRAR